MTQWARRFLYPRHAPALIHHIALTIGLLLAAIASLLVFGQPVSAAALPLTTGSHIVFQTSSGGAIYIVNPDGSGAFRKSA